jgi:hypothetical protein
MTLRSVHSRTATTDAVRRMRAVLRVLDHDLAECGAYLTVPIPATTLSETEWQAAEAARAAVEHSLRGLEVEAAVVLAQANDWRAKAVAAAQRGDSQLVEQARIRCADVERVYRSYVEEMSSVRVFLQEWTVRVTRDPTR